MAAVANARHSLPPGAAAAARSGGGWCCSMCAPKQCCCAPKKVTCNTSNAGFVGVGGWLGVGEGGATAWLGTAPADKNAPLAAVT
jgi:hypothetical protein